MTFLHSQYFGAFLAFVLFALILRAVKQSQRERQISWENRVVCTIPRDYQAPLVDRNGDIVLFPTVERRMR